MQEVEETNHGSANSGGYTRSDDLEAAIITLAENMTTMAQAITQLAAIANLNIERAKEE